MKISVRRLLLQNKGNVRIEGSGKTIYDANVTGTPANDSWDRYQKFMLDIAKQRNLWEKK
ncbi:MAG: hypothetical protein ACLU4N_12825 [Butyricimonas faecihominis]